MQGRRRVRQRECLIVRADITYHVREREGDVRGRETETGGFIPNVVTREQRERLLDL